MINPSQAVLEQLAAELDIPKKVAINCLDPDYLPHIENYGSTQFILLRLMEPEIKLTADTVQELTTKVALFIGPERVVSVHRLPLKEIEEITVKIKKMNQADINKIILISLFFEQVSLGFDNPLTKLEYKLEKFEERMFQMQRTKSLLLEGYYIKRQASAFRKVMKLTVDAVSRLLQRVESAPGKLQEARDRLDRNLFYAEDVFDNVQSLLNLHMAIESQRTNEGSFRTNEIMRVLTVLTIFFLPLNFVAGVFGMNFQHIPLLSHPNGFGYSIALMLVISIALSYYVIRKGWLAHPRTDKDHQ
ncbi:MAG: magnesium and cobalt transport protein [Bdellovibrionaceae bacterium]|nr:magnesium and cobalt transport protein [Bdellovibrio sp.]